MIAKTYKIITLDDYEDLTKAHVKAHFKRDPKTGKLIFIKDYDDERHKHLVHAIFKKGDKVKVNNPKSKHHDKEVVVSGYNEKYGVSTKVPGQKHAGEFHPHHLDHVDVKTKPVVTSKTPVKASKAPVAAITTLITTLAQAKAELGLLGLSWSHKDMQHEKKRIASMSVSRMGTRIDKIKNPQKLYNLYRAWENEFYPFPTTGSQAELLYDVMKTKLIEMAKAKQIKAKLKTPDKKPDPKPAAPADPGKFVKGERVKINNTRSKFHDKEGTVTNHHDKYGVRVKRVDFFEANTKSTAQSAINP